MTKILNVIPRPYISSRASTAFQLGVIQSLPQFSEAWLCNEFINLRYLSEDKIRCDFLHKDFWFINTKMFVRQSLLFSKETLDFNSFDVIKYIISAINDGKYVTGDFNAFYIPNKIEYKTINRCDTYLIYGYDQYNEIFYLLGDTFKGYAPHEITFTDYIKSISNRDDGMFNINVMEYNLDFKFELSKEKLKSNLINYIASRDSYVFHNITSPTYGIEAIKNLKKDVLSDYGFGRVLGDKSFEVLCEHKQLMLLRIKYLKDHMNIKVGSLTCLFEEVLNLSKAIAEKSNEFKEKHRLDIYTDVINLLDEIISKDFLACSSLLQVL